MNQRPMPRLSRALKRRDSATSMPDCDEFSSVKLSVALPYRSGYHRLLGLWVLRAISSGMGRKHYLRACRSRCEIDDFLGLPEEIDQMPRERVDAHLDAMLSKLECDGLQPAFNAAQRKNFDGLAELLGLNKAELAVLQYMTCARVEPVMEDVHDCIGKLYFTNTSGYLSVVLGLPESAVRKALGPKSRLRACGIIGHGDTEAGKIEFFSPTLAKSMVRSACLPQRILRQFGVAAPPPTLGLMDFSKHEKEIQIMLPHLRKALSKHRAGVNVLLYGPPGTGKTELTRVIAKSIRAKAFEIASEDQDATPIEGKARFQALQASQAIFRNTRTVLVFDEAEDVLVSDNPFHRNAAEEHKGWFNQMLENNRLPVIWISNSIENLDPAFARRFDLIMEVPILPKAQRTKILKEQAVGLLSLSTIARMASSDNLSPAVVARSCGVVRGLGSELQASQREDAVCRLISNTLRAQGHADPVTMNLPAFDPGTYDVANLNTTVDLQEIAQALRSTPCARICIYGPPGTGKTAFAHWLASYLQLPIHTRKASELLSPYHGETEKNIARCFENAAREGAVLVMDEIDSFLQERSRAERSWEVTQVNEMLTRIESYPGILIASTNLVDRLDVASLRRFDLKLFFDYLQPDQIRRLLISHCKNLQLPAPNALELSSASNLESITPGDFAAVARRHRFDPSRKATDFIEKLATEAQYKMPRLRKIGFQS